MRKQQSNDYFVVGTHHLVIYVAVCTRTYAQGEQPRPAHEQVDRDVAIYRYV